MAITLPELPLTVASDPMLPRMATVIDARQELQHTWTLVLEDEGGPGLPGQFNMLYLPGVGEIPISVSGDPSSPHPVHTVRAVGAVSKALTGLQAGDMLGVRGPFGRGWPVDALDGQDVILMAGGIGLAPLRPLIYRLLADTQPDRRVHLLYGTRSPEDILYAGELTHWERHAGFSVHVTVDHAVGEWQGRVGVVTGLLQTGMFDPTRTLACLCGPEVMMRYSANRLMELGLSAERIYVSLERNMKCAIGHCGHCQYGPTFICRDGAVFRHDQVGHLFNIREL